MLKQTIYTWNTAFNAVNIPILDKFIVLEYVLTRLHWIRKMYEWGGCRKTGRSDNIPFYFPRSVGETRYVTSEQFITFRLSSAAFSFSSIPTAETALLFGDDGRFGGVCVTGSASLNSNESPPLAVSLHRISVAAKDFQFRYRRSIGSIEY